MRSLALVLALTVAGCHCNDKLVSGNAAIRFEPRELTLGPTYVGDPVEETIILKNDSNVAQDVKLVVEGPFGADLAMASLSAGGFANITVRFPAVKAGTFPGKLVAVDYDVELALTGIAEDVPACAQADACRSSSFDRRERMCIETLAADGTACAVSSPCSSGGTCQQGSCVPAAPSCPASTDPCKASMCDPELGCAMQPVADDTACGVADCIGAHVCKSGSCMLDATKIPAGCTTMHPGGLWTKLPMSGPFGLATDASKHAYVARPSAGLVTRIDTVLGMATGDIGTGVTPTGLALDDQRLYVANQGSSNLSIVDRASLAVGTAQLPPGMSPFIPALSGGFLYVSGAGSDLLKLSQQTTTVVDTLAGTWSHANGIAFHPTLPKMYVSARDSGEVTEVDLTTFRLGRRFTPGSGPQQLVVAPNGNELWLAREYGALGVIDLATGLLVNEVMAATGGFGLALTPDGQQLYLTQPGLGKVTRVDLATRTVVGTLPTGGRPRRVGFSSNGTVAVITNEDGWVDLAK